MAVVNQTSVGADAELQRKIEEYKARERIYLAGLIEQEAALCQLRQMASSVLGAYGDVSRAAVRGALYDPASNMEVLLLRQKAREKDLQINQLREELEANRFDQKQPAGLSLMRKCKALLVENQELGEQIGEERLAEFRAAFQAEQRQNTELYQRCRDASEFCKELSQENDKLQGTIAKVAGKLREANAELDVLRKERAEAKAKRKREKEQQRIARVAADSAAAAEAATGGPAGNAGSVEAATAPGQSPPAASDPAAMLIAGQSQEEPIATTVTMALGGALVEPAATPVSASKPEKHEKDKKKKRKTEKVAAAADSGKEIP